MSTSVRSNPGTLDAKTHNIFKATFGNCFMLPSVALSSLAALQAWGEILKDAPLPDAPGPASLSLSAAYPISVSADTAGGCPGMLAHPRPSTACAAEAPPRPSGGFNLSNVLPKLECERVLSEVCACPAQLIERWHV